MSIMSIFNKPQIQISTALQINHEKTRVVRLDLNNYFNVVPKTKYYHLKFSLKTQCRLILFFYRLRSIYLLNKKNQEVYRGPRKELIVVFSCNKKQMKEDEQV